MCYAVYIGSDAKQPTKTFVDGETVLYLEELSQEKEVIGLKPKFSKTNIYYVGSYQGCSCGFAYDPTNSDEEIRDEDKAEVEMTIKSVAALLDLIDSFTEKEDIEFYCCWEGDWESPVEERQVIDIREVTLGLNYFELQEKSFILFKQQLTE